MQYKIHDLGYKTIAEALLSFEGISFLPNELTYPAQYLDTIGSLWNEDQFEKINLPKNLYSLTQEEISLYTQTNDIRILDMPIKFPGTDYRLPKEVQFLKDIIKKAISHEHVINPNINDYYCYLTFDRRLVSKGKTTRKAGLHVDGFQGARLGDKLPIDHSYLLHSDLATLFYNQPFKVHNSWDKNCHNYFEGFEKQKLLSNVVTYPNNSWLLIDAYCLHEAPMVLEDTYRTFLRLSFTVREFDRLGNAHNPLFNYDWEMFPRDTQMTLTCPTKF
jgi:hypothetical protein